MEQEFNIKSVYAAEKYIIGENHYGIIRQTFSVAIMAFSAYAATQDAHYLDPSINAYDKICETIAKSNNDDLDNAFDRFKKFYAEIIPVINKSAQPQKKINSQHACQCKYEYRRK